MKLPVVIAVLSFAYSARAEKINSDSLMPPPAKSEAFAYELALGSTIIPVLIGSAMTNKNPGGSAAAMTGRGLLFFGATLGPSAGQVYAGSYKLGLIGFDLRALGFFQLLYESDNGFKNATPLIMMESIAVYSLATVYSFLDTHVAVKRANEKAKAQNFGFSPKLFPSSNGGVKPGVMGWVRF